MILHLLIFALKSSETNGIIDLHKELKVELVDIPISLE